MNQRATHVWRSARQWCRTSRVSIVTAAALLVVGVSPASAGQFQPDTIRFAVPPWPGVIVKTRIVSDILDTLGYQTKNAQLGTSLAFQSLANRDNDIYLAYWSPNMDTRAHKYLDDGSVDVLADNVDNAEWGIGVPEYVWNAGIHTVADLARHRDRFEGKIYGIEPGSVLNEKIKTAIRNDASGLGDWQLVRSSTAIMLAAVKRRYDKQEWVAWGAWSPHWMINAFHTRFLKDTDNADLADKVVIKTVAAHGFAGAHPAVATFFRRFHVPSTTQSRWIYAYKKEQTPLAELSRRWISQHLDRIAPWVKGLKTRDGQPAMAALRQRYAD